MPRVRNQLTITAGTVGVYAPDPDLFGPLTVEPIFPGSFQAKRQGYRWVCHMDNGSIVFIPFRDFLPDKPLTPLNSDVN